MSPHIQSRIIRLVHILIITVLLIPLFTPIIEAATPADPAQIEAQRRVDPRYLPTDAYERRDSLTHPFFMGALTSANEQLSIEGRTLGETVRGLDKEDFLAFHLARPAKVRVDVYYFNEVNATLQVEVLDLSGYRRGLASSRIDGASLRDLRLEPGYYIIHLTHVKGFGTDYNVQVTLQEWVEMPTHRAPGLAAPVDRQRAPSAPARVQDAYEPNDTLDTAYDFGTILPPGFNIWNAELGWTDTGVDNDDYYRGVILEPSNFFIRVDYQYDSVHAELLDETGDTIALGNSSGSAVIISAQNLPPGAYYLHVWGAIEYSLYNVWWGIRSLQPTDTPTPTPTDTPSPTPTDTPSQCPEDPDEPNEWIDQAKPIDVNVAIERVICPEGDEDFFAFEATQGQMIHITLTDLPEDFDLVLWDQNGNYLADSSSSGTAEEIIQIVAPYSGVYYAHVSGTKPDGSFRWSPYPYVLLVQVEAQSIETPTLTPTPTITSTPTPSPTPCADAYEPNNNIREAQDIFAINTVIACFRNRNDEDVYKRVMNPGDVTRFWIIDVSQVPEGTRVSVISPQERIEKQEVIRAGVDHMLVEISQAGPWYLLLTPPDYTPPSGLGYRFSHIVSANLTPTPAACTDPNEPNNTLAQATDVTTRTSVQACLANASDVDFYKRTMNAGDKGKYWHIALSRLPKKAQVTVRDPEGALVATGEGGAGTLDVYVATTGTYFVSIVSGEYVPASGLQYTFAYTLDGTAPPPASYVCAAGQDTNEPNDTLSTATDLDALGGLATACFERNDDQDFYKVDVPSSQQGQVLAFRLIDLPTAVTLFIYGPNGEVLRTLPPDRIERGQNVHNFIYADITQGGVYTLQVSPSFTFASPRASSTTQQLMYTVEYAFVPPTPTPTPTSTPTVTPTPTATPTFTPTPTPTPTPTGTAPEAVSVQVSQHPLSFNVLLRADVIYRDPEGCRNIEWAELWFGDLGTQTKAHFKAHVNGPYPGASDVGSVYLADEKGGWQLIPYNTNFPQTAENSAAKLMGASDLNRVGGQYIATAWWCENSTDLRVVWAFYLKQSMVGEHRIVGRAADITGRQGLAKRLQRVEVLAPTPTPVPGSTNLRFSGHTYVGNKGVRNVPLPDVTFTIEKCSGSTSPLATNKSGSNGAFSITGLMPTSTGPNDRFCLTAVAPLGYRFVDFAYQGTKRLTASVGGNGVTSPARVTLFTDSVATMCPGGCLDTVAFDSLDIWFLPAGMVTEEPTPTPTSTIPPTPTRPPTATPTPTATPQPVPNQSYRDVGKVRVWADKFEQSGDTTVAKGRVYIGKQGNDPNGKDRFFRVDPITVNVGGNDYGLQGTVSWKNSGDLTIEGALMLQPHAIPILAGDKLLVNRDTGVVTVSGLVKKYLIDKLGKQPKFDFNPQVQVSVLWDYVRLTGEVTIKDLPENPDAKFNVEVRLKFDGSVQGTVTNSKLTFKIAGGTLVAENLSLDTDGGLRIGKATLTFPGIKPIVVNDMTIGPDGFTFKNMTAGAEFDIPPLNLGDFFIIEGEAKKPNQPLKAILHLEVQGKTYRAGRVPASVQITAFNAKYKIEIAGRVRLPKLPVNSNVTSSNMRLTLQDGKLTGSIGKLEITLAGRPFVMHDLSYDFIKMAANRAPGHARAAEAVAFKYVLIAKRSEWSLPKSWQLTGMDTKLFIENVSISDQSPYIHIGGAGTTLSIKKSYWLGGKPGQGSGVRFNLEKAELKFVDTFQKYVFVFYGSIDFILGGKKNTVGQTGLGGGIKLTVDNGKVTSTITRAQLQVGGLNLLVTNMKYEDDKFTAQEAKLTFPQSWMKFARGGTVAAVVRNLRIDQDGVSWDGFGSEIGLNDLQLGKVLQLKNMKAQIVLNAKKEYEVTISGTVRVLTADLQAARAAGEHLRASTVQGVETAFQVVVNNDGKVTGTVSAFNLDFYGFTIKASGIKWTDDEMTVSEAVLKLPASVGGAEAKLWGMTIGGDKDFDVKGGRFKIKNLSFAGIGVENAFAEFKQLDNGRYTVAASAKMKFAAFAVEGKFRIEVDTKGTVWLREVFVAFEVYEPASGIALDSTGLFITRISGRFSMSEHDLTISFGFVLETPGKVANTTVLKLEGKVTLRLKPSFKLEAGMDTWLVGLKLASAYITITPTAFRLDVSVDFKVLKFVATLAFGLDSDGEFTFVARVKAELYIPPKVIFGLLPTGYLRIAEASVEVGKLRHTRTGYKTWGAKGYVSVLGLHVYSVVTFKPLKFQLGGTTEYQAVYPNIRYLAEHPATPGRDVFLVTIGPSRQVAFLEKVSPVHEDTADLLLVTMPDGRQITLEPTFSGRVEGQIVRLYVVDNPPVGQWRLEPRSGNIVQILGTDPAPQLQIQVEQLDVPPTVWHIGEETPVTRVRVVKGSPAYVWGDEPQRMAQVEDYFRSQSALQLTQSGVLRITWSADDNTPDNVQVEIYAEDENGFRWPITTTTQLHGVYDWKPTLASGVYTFTVAADDGQNMPVMSQVRVVYQDTTSPAPPKDVRAQMRADGTAVITWDDTAADPDVQGYVITLENTEPYTVMERIDTYVMSGISWDETARVSIAAVDRSGNVSDPVTVSVRGPELAVAGTYPADTEAISTTHEVKVTFNQPVTVTEFTVTDGQGTPVPGASEPITYGLGAVLPQFEPVWGVRFVPESGWLAPGTYTARVVAQVDAPTALALQRQGFGRLVAQAGTTATYEWTFRVTATPQRMWLPVVTR